MPLSESVQPTREAALAELRRVMKSEFGLASEQIQLTTHLVDDLDLDSIDFVDIAVSLEEAIGIRLGEEELKSVKTVQDAVDVIHAELVGRGSGSA